MDFLVTPTILLAILCGPAIINLVWRKFDSDSSFSNSTAACIGISLMFVFTGMGHFFNPKPMAEMLPAFVPSRPVIVFASGVLEVVAGIVILPVRIRKLVSWGLIAMLIVFLPLNIFAAVNRIGPGGHTLGPIYLIVRVPLQFLFISWIYWFGVRVAPGKVGGSLQ